MALKNGSRGLKAGSSLGRLLAERRNASNRTNTMPLNEQIVLTWADAYFAQHNTWPNRKSGVVEGTSVRWDNIDQLLRLGLRGLKKSGSLTALLAKRRGVERHHSVRRPLTETQILRWSDEFFRRHGFYPAVSETESPAPGETWRSIDSSLRSGTRGLRGGSSLWQLLKENRGLTKTNRTENLSEAEILGWADQFFAKHGRWPDQNSGEVPNTEEDWKSLDVALQKGYRNLDGGSSISRLLEKHGRKRNPMNRPQLTVSQIVSWAEEYVANHGNPPTKRSGPVGDRDENWGAIDQALRSGVRGLRGGTSLARLLKLRLRRRK